MVRDASWFPAGSKTNVPRAPVPPMESVEVGTLLNSAPPAAAEKVPFNANACPLKFINPFVRVTAPTNVRSLANTTLPEVRRFKVKFLNVCGPAAKGKVPNAPLPFTVMSLVAFTVIVLPTEF